MRWFGQGRREEPDVRYDPEEMTPAVRCSICTGEQVAGFRRKKDGGFTEVMLIRGEADLLEFRKRYGIRGEVERFW